MRTTQVQKIDKMTDAIRVFVTQLEEIRSDRQDVYDNMTLSKQESELGDAVTEEIDELDEAIANLESAMEHLGLAAQI